MKRIKNIVYILLGAFIVLASCKNNTKKPVIQNKPIQDAIPPVTTKYKVTFEVEGKSGGSLKAQLKDATETFTSSPQDVESGKTVLFTATPAPEDYEIEKWTKDGTEVNEKKPTYELKIEANVTVKVKFKKKNTPPSPTPTKYKVTFEVEGKAGGSLKAQLKDATETFTSSPQDVESGKTVLFTATPAPEDYEIEKWTKDGTEVNEKKPTYELKIEANVTVKVKFKKKEATPSPTPTKYKVTFEVEGKTGGSLKAQLKDASEALASSPQDVEKGKTVLFTSTPDPEYEIEKWTKDGIEANEKKPTYELKIEANVTVKVKFKKKEAIPTEPPVIEGDKATYTIKDVKFVMKKVDSVSQASLGFGTGKHTANLSTYWVAETEVTQELWDEVMKGNPSWFDGTGLKTHSSGSVINTNPKDDDNQMKRPVDSVNWYDCIVFCNELTKRCMSENDCVYYSDEAWTKIYTKDDAENKLIPYMYKIGEDATNISKEMNKKGFRLPTNDEWEWAAKAKAHSSYAGTEDIELLHKYAWFKQDNDNSKWVTREVKKLFPNAFGLYDMNGNVMEWCWDGFSNITGDAGENPITKGKAKVLKGGSYFTSKTIMSFSCTLDQRMRLEPDTKTSLTQCGMRLACFD